MKPIIISGPYGSGKSTLALVIARAIGVGIYYPDPLTINKIPSLPGGYTYILDNCTIDNKLVRELERYDGPPLIVTTMKSVPQTTIPVWTLEQIDQLDRIPQQQILG